MIGKTLGNRYRILRELGSGGMAWVYLAEDITEARLVAIKVLYPQFGEDLAYIQRFNREAKLAATLSDAHIVRVLDYGASRDVHYLVMEYIEGQDLRSVIDERGNLPWPEALQLLDQLAVALEHAHLHGVVHRDIKPHNLMITSDGMLKVLDFGIARARMLPSLTQSGFVGSPYYISPEQAMGEEVDIRSDIYSSGVVLYEMLSGRVPYDAASPWSIISQHIASEPPRIDLWGTQIPATTETLLRRMIAKRPEDRFQTPTALREAIACVLEGRPLPETLDMQSLIVPDRLATAEGLYQRARQAIQEEDWQRAVDLLNQVVKLNPEHTEASEQLAHAGRQARLAALYTAACRAMEGGRWQEVVDELSEIIAVEPGYRNAADLLDQARAAQDNLDVAQTVSSLYDQGVAHVRAKTWEEAARCLRRVQQLSPGYKQTESLLAEAERHLRPGRKWLRGMQSALRRVALALAVIFALLAVIAGAYFFSQTNDTSGAAHLATAISGDLDQIYQDAQSAFQAGNWDEVIQLTDALLAEDPNYVEAQILREQAQVKRALEPSFVEGEKAYSTRRWDEAIEVLSNLRQADVTFRPDQVQSMLCDAYLQRGRMSVASHQATSDATAIQAALKDFEAGLRLCPDRQALTDERNHANSFLYALKAEVFKDYDTMIRELTPVVTAASAYANGAARHMLYSALAARGEIYQQAGELDSALSDYERALALGETDTLNVSVRRDQVLARLQGGTPPATSQPNETPDIPAYKYAAPVLINPQNEASFHGKFTVIMLEWEPIRNLAQDEYYDVTIMHYVGDEPRYWGAAVKEAKWQVPVEAGFGQAGNDRFYWWVTVRRSKSAPGPGQLDRALSPRSDTRNFYWSE